MSFNYNTMFGVFFSSVFIRVHHINSYIYELSVTGMSCQSQLISVGGQLHQQPEHLLVGGASVT